MAGEEGKSTITIVDDQIEIINNISGAQLIYVDGAQGLINIHGVVKINLYQLVQEFDRTSETPGSFKKVIVARLAMTTQTAQSLATWLATHVKDSPDTSPQASPRKSSDGE